MNEFGKLFLVIHFSYYVTAMIKASAHKITFHYLCKLRKIGRNFSNNYKNDKYIKYP